MPRRKRNAGSSSDGTEDSDFSADLEHTDSSESDANTRSNTRLTRASVRLSQSSQDSSPTLNAPTSRVPEEALANFIPRRVTRSQNQLQNLRLEASAASKTYPLRRSRSSGSDSEQPAEAAERGRELFAETEGGGGGDDDGGGEGGSSSMPTYFPQNI